MSENNLKKYRYVYYCSTAILSLIMCFSSGKYFLDYDEVVLGFRELGFPTYIIYPLASAKVLGLLAVISRKSAFLANLAYAGFFYNFILAFFAHVMISDNEQWAAVVAIIALTLSFYSSKKLYKA